MPRRTLLSDCRAGDTYYSRTVAGVFTLLREAVASRNARPGALIHHLQGPNRAHFVTVPTPPSTNLDDY